MVKYLFYICLLVSVSLGAQILPFSPGEDISASKFNSNFEYVKSRAQSILPEVDYSPLVIFSPGDTVSANIINQNYDFFTNLFWQKSFSMLPLEPNGKIFSSTINENFNNLLLGIEAGNEIVDFEAVDGDLLVQSGETFVLPAGSVKKYSSVVVEEEGVLEIQGDSLLLTEIAVDGNVVIDGLIRGRGYFVGGSFNGTSQISSENISFSIPQSAGGNGGATGPTVYGGGSSNSGNGGGGGRADVPCLAGTGATGNSASPSSPGAGIGSNGGCGCGCIGGGGGAGGYRGEHGHSLVLIVNGQVYGNGIIDLSGESGFNGGPGITGGNGGGGGGGGAGGSGGYLRVRYYQVFDENITVNLSGGLGGIGGVRGEANTHNPGNPGGNGQAGASNSIVKNPKFPAP